jgi:hypothetical protein
MADEIVTPAAAPAAPAPAAAAPNQPSTSDLPKVETTPSTAEIEAKLQEIVEQHQQPEATAAEPLPLVVPQFVSLKERTEEREQYVSEFAQVAGESGIKPEIAQGLLDHVVETASALTYEAADQYTTDVDARESMVKMFGEEIGTQIIRDAQQTVRALGPKVAAYLDRTNLGNDLGVLVALSQAGYSTRTPEQAQKELAATVATKQYLAGDKLLVLKVHALSRIANRQDGVEQPKMAGLLNREPVSAVEDRQQALRDEMAALVPKKGEMTREQADKWMAINKQLNGGN